MSRFFIALKSYQSFHICEASLRVNGRYFARKSRTHSAKYSSFGFKEVKICCQRAKCKQLPVSENGVNKHVGEMTGRRNSCKCRTGMDLREQNMVSGQQTETARARRAKDVKGKSRTSKKRNRERIGSVKRSITS